MKDEQIGKCGGCKKKENVGFSGLWRKTNKSLLARFNVMLEFTQTYNYILNVSTGRLGSSVTKDVGRCEDMIERRPERRETDLFPHPQDRV